MTASESKFRNWLLKRYPGAYIKKVPDFKVTGSPILRGLPDYLVCFKGETIWWEVKAVKSKKSWNCSEINVFQHIEFAHMLAVGVDVNIAVLDGLNRWHFYKFSEVIREEKNGSPCIPFINETE